MINNELKPNDVIYTNRNRIEIIDYDTNLHLKDDPFEIILTNNFYYYVGKNSLKMDTIIIYIMNGKQISIKKDKVIQILKNIYSNYSALEQLYFYDNGSNKYYWVYIGTNDNNMIDWILIMTNKLF